MAGRKLRLARAVVIVLAAKPEGLTFEELLRELENLRRKGLIDEDDLNVERLQELLDLGQATRVIVNGNGRFRLNSGVKKDKLYWSIVRREVKEIYGIEIPG